MYNSEIKEIFDSLQSISYKDSYNIGTVCSHLGSADFTTKRIGSDRPFGFRGDPQDLVLFSQIIMSSGNINDAMIQAGLGKYKAKKLINILNAAAATRGLPPVYNITLYSASKVVICDQTGQSFPSLTQVARTVGIDITSISRHINRHSYYKAIKGYTFSLEGKVRSIEEYSELLAPPKGAIEIVCDQTGQAFPSITAAAKIMGLNASCLSLHMRGIRRAVKKYTFSEKQSNSITAIKRKAKHKRAIEIVCDQTGQAFPSITAAAFAMKLHNSGISGQLNGYFGNRATKGYTFSKVSHSQDTGNKNCSQSLKASA